MSITSIIEISSAELVASARDKVRTIIRAIPIRWENKLGSCQMFSTLRLITADKQFVGMSIQASGMHYCQPKKNLPNLMEYEKVEIAILPDNRNTGVFKLGFSFDVATGKDIPVKTSDVTYFGRPKTGWLRPEHLGFTRITCKCDDVLPYISMEGLVADLTDFFMSGGTIDGIHKGSKALLDALGVVNKCDHPVHAQYRESFDKIGCYKCGEVREG